MSDADALDLAIDDALAGRTPKGVDQPEAAVLTRLANVHAVPVPQALEARVREVVTRDPGRRWIPARVAAACLALAFASHSFGGFFLGEWVAEQVGGHYDAHTSVDNGIAYLGLTVLLIAGALRPRWLDLAAVAGAPVGVFLGISGAPELVSAPSAGSLHLIEGVAAVALLALWWRARRYGPPQSDEGEI